MAIVFPDTDGGGALDTQAPYANENPLVLGGYLYWARGNAPSGIWRVPVTGGEPTVLYEASPAAIWNGQIVTDGTNLYWFEYASGNFAIVRMPVAGGVPPTTVVPVAKTPACTRSIAGTFAPQLAVDGTSVYWLCPPNVYKAPK
jgi:hypothetical protein